MSLRHHSFYSSFVGIELFIELILEKICFAVSAGVEVWSLEVQLTMRKRRLMVETLQTNLRVPVRRERRHRQTEDAVHWTYRQMILLIRQSVKLPLTCSFQLFSVLFASYLLCFLFLLSFDSLGIWNWDRSAGRGLSSWLVIPNFASPNKYMYVILSIVTCSYSSSHWQSLYML